ncbi:hypothetical protein K504DRAFT_100696 [Pleomassaria siparia CBS 279.74]|uniref:Uncharacterized protein n=1 Tax=Pleomassaria siparia CBS 279.74 TaxID=1314801 RepID=A0A6G1JYW5_9PLEO|nr:hypothetical protein K504DRAFT_100696 [Pleomassaria siparia CBS 279.74]
MYVPYMYTVCIQVCTECVLYTPCFVSCTGDHGNPGPSQGTPRNIRGRSLSRRRNSLAGKGLPGALLLCFALTSSLFQACYFVTLATSSSPSFRSLIAVFRYYPLMKPLSLIVPQVVLRTVHTHISKAPSSRRTTSPVTYSFTHPAHIASPQSNFESRPIHLQSRDGLCRHHRRTNSLA